VQNYNITLTDGQWNGDNNGTFFSTADANAVTPLPDGKTNYAPSTSARWRSTATIRTGTPCRRLPFTTGPPTCGRPERQRDRRVAVLSGHDGLAADHGRLLEPAERPGHLPHLVQFTIGIGLTAR